MKLSRRLFLLSPLALAYKPSWGALSFPLPQGHFVPAKMPMHPVYPRPDSETQPHARHRWAHPDFRYEIPIGVQGGAWPFKYEIINGPSGATIGRYYGDPDYGVIKWRPENGDSGIKTFTIRVTDQEMNTVDLTWTTTIDANQFVFVDASAASTGTGTITDPLMTFADWYKNSATDSSYRNKIIVFRTGNYTVSGDINNQPTNVRMESSYKTPSLIGYPDETPIFNCATAKFFFADGGFDDLFISGIRFENGRSDVANSHFFWITGDNNRITFWGNYFYNLENGTDGSDNPSCIFISDTSNLKQNYLIKGNTFDTILTNGPNGSFSDMYVASYILAEENTARNCHSSYGIWMKGVHDHISVRANTFFQNNTQAPVVLGTWSPAGATPRDQEVCWNLLKSSSGFSLRLGQERSPNSTNISAYRNTIIGAPASIRFDITGHYQLDANVAQVTDPSSFNGTNVVSNIPNLTGNSSSSLVDTQTGLLISSWRSQYLGIAGHELSSEYIKSPKPPSNIRAL